MNQDTSTHDGPPPNSLHRHVSDIPPPPDIPPDPDQRSARKRLHDDLESPTPDGCSTKRSLLSSQLADSMQPQAHFHSLQNVDQDDDVIEIQFDQGDLPSPVQMHTSTVLNDQVSSATATATAIFAPATATTSNTTATDSATPTATTSITTATTSVTTATALPVRELTATTVTATGTALNDQFDYVPTALNEQAVNDQLIITCNQQTTTTPLNEQHTDTPNMQMQEDDDPIQMFASDIESISSSSNDDDDDADDDFQPAAKRCLRSNAQITRKSLSNNKPPQVSLNTGTAATNGFIISRVEATPNAVHSNATSSKHQTTRNSNKNSKTSNIAASTATLSYATATSKGTQAANSSNNKNTSTAARNKPATNTATAPTLAATTKTSSNNVSSSNNNNKHRVNKQQAPATSTTSTAPVAKKCIDACAQSFITEDELYKHFVDTHCFDGTPVPTDAQVHALGFELCTRCSKVFKCGLVHASANCRVATHRDKALSNTFADNHRLFRQKFCSFNFATLKPSVHMPSVDHLHRSRAPTLNFMPGGEELRADFRRIFVAIVRSIQKTANTTHMNVISNWTLLLSLPRLLLCIPTTNINDKMSTATTVHHRISLFLDGQFEALLHSYNDTIATLDRSRSTNSINSPDATARQVTSIIKTSGDIGRAARRLESTASIADYKQISVQDSIDELLPLREQVPYPRTNTANMPCPTLDSDTVRRALITSSKGASGITGWHQSHIAAIASSTDGLQALTYVLNCLLSRSLPQPLLECINTSVLVPLQKPDGGVRPILIGDALVRLLSKCVVVAEQSHIAQRFHPVQVAVATKGGNEIAIHGIRAHLDAHPDHIAIAVDFKNAFGSIKREKVAAALDSFDYDRVKYTKWYFNAFTAMPSPVLTPTGSIIYYSEGVPQGGPTSMQWFCLAIHPLLANMHALLSAKGGSVVAYADDVFLLADPVSAFEAFNHINQYAIEFGLRVCHSKCNVLATTPTATNVATHLAERNGIPNKPQSALSILGVPVGTHAAECQLASSLVTGDVFTALKTINNLQCRLLLLRRCISAKYHHFARTMTPDASLACLTEVDNLCRDALSSIISTEQDPLSDTAWLEASLPLSSGGLGLKHLVQQRVSDYFASASCALLRWRNVLSSNHQMIKSIIDGQSRSATAIKSALDHCHQLCKELLDTPIKPSQQDPALPEKLLQHISSPALPRDIKSMLSGTTPSQYKLQKQLAQIHARLTFRKLWRSIPPMNPHRIQLLAKTNGTPSIAFNVIPTEPGLSVSNNELIIMARQYLSLPIESNLGLASTYTKCCCSSQYSRSNELCQGSHLFNCKHQGAYTVRHNALMDVVASAFKSVGITPELERVVHTPPQQGANNNRLPSRRFDIVASAADSNSRLICIDVSVTSHLTKEYYKQALNKPLVNAANACTSKHTKYRDDVQHDTEVLVPLIAETSGALHQNYLKLYEHLSTRVNGAPPLQASQFAPTFASYWMQRTSIVLWRETIRSLLRIAQMSSRLAGRAQHGHQLPSVPDASLASA